MRRRFDQQLSLLNDNLTKMGALCEEAIGISVQALLEVNHDTLTKKVRETEQEINQMERDIESLCLKLLLQQQPVARDLRQITAALKMITDMERIGDQADDIAEIISTLDGRVCTDCQPIIAMARGTMMMVKESVDAYVKRDGALAEKVIKDDDIVDALFEDTKASLIAMIGEDPSDGGYALDLLMIGKYFERIGDHAVNIAGWVLFSLTGIHKGAIEL